MARPRTPRPAAEAQPAARPRTARPAAEAKPAPPPRAARKAPRRRSARRTAPRLRPRRRSRVAAALVVGLFLAGLAMMALFQATRSAPQQPFRFPTPAADGAAGDAAAPGGDGAPAAR